MKKLLLKTQLLALFLVMTGIAAYAQALEWAQSIGGASIDDVRNMATDKDGNVYITGSIYGTADFNKGGGKDTLKPYGSNDIFLAKYDAAGNYKWAIKMGGTGADYGKGVTVDNKGNVYVTGYFFGKAVFNPGSTDTLRAGAGFNDIYVAKYDANGNYKWAINMGGTMQNYGYGIAVNDSGQIYVTGAFSGKTDFDPSPAVKDTAYLTALPGTFFSPGFDVYLAKYDSTGKYMWAQRMGSSGWGDYGYSIAVDKAGNAYVAGYYGNYADFDPGSASCILISKGINDGFVAKYDNTGKYIWAKGIGSKADDNALAIALDNTNNVYVTGYFSDTTYFYDTTSQSTGITVKSDSIVSAGNYDMFVTKYDSAGNYIWSTKVGGTKDDVGYGISIGRGNMVCATGYFADTAIVKGGDTLRAGTSNTDALIAKFNSDGKYKWAGALGGNKTDMGYGVVCDQHGNIYATGNYTDAADLGPGSATASYTAKGSTDIYLLKLACSDTSSFLLPLQECGASFTLNGNTYTASGTYKQVLTNLAGCDSTLTVQLVLTDPQAMINVNGYTLSTTMRFVTYQWIKDGVVITGATDSSFTVSANGGYQVVVTNEYGCTDTSDVFRVTNVGIDDQHTIASQIKVYPNPASGVMYIMSPVTVSAVLTNLDGRHIMSVANAQSISLQALPAGVYFLRILDADNNLLKVEKVVKK